jgi:hypothetical protein
MDKTLKLNRFLKIMSLLKNSTMLRFSNYWKMFIFSLIPWIIIFISLQQIAISRNYENMLEINEDLDNFFWIMVGGLFFTSMAVTSTSYFSSIFLNNLKQLNPLIESNRFDKESQLEPNNKWYDAFIKDVNSMRWIFPHFIIISIISTIIHYIGYGYQVVETFGWIFYIITLLALLWPNLFIGIWVLWFMLAQYFHIYKFYKSIDSNSITLHIGVKPFNNSFLRFLLPIKTDPKLIKVDIFNTDNLGGLKPLASLSLMGVILQGILFSVLVPLLVVVNLLVASILLPLFAIVIISSYIIGISSLKDAIRTEKTKHLSKINERLSTLASKIIDAQLIPGEDVNYLKNVNEQFAILDQMGEKIEKLAESPRSLTAILKIVISSVLPLISFVSIDQFTILT